MSYLTEQHFAKNFELQLSGYYTGRRANNGKGYYYFSKRIPSTNWNHCFNLDPLNDDAFEFGKVNARERGMPLAFFMREADLSKLSDSTRSFTVNRERWMSCDPSTIEDLQECAQTKFDFTSIARPSDDYFTVLGDLFENPDYNDRFQKYYIPTLKEAVLGADVSVRHGTLYFQSEPVSCGSVYISDGFAGLYNVGTRATFAKRGYGAQISHSLTRLAFDSGASSVFLQCVIGTHVERLYGNLGYESKECPGIVVFD